MFYYKNRFHNKFNNIISIVLYIFNQTSAMVQTTKAKINYEI